MRSSAVVLALLLAGCESREIVEQRRADQQMRYARELMRGLTYVRYDGFCFATTWGGAGNGGPAMARVPCDSVPVGKLIEFER